MWLTGDPAGPPLAAPGDIAARLSGLSLALGFLAPGLSRLDAPALLGERAAIFGLRRQGQVSCGGSARLLPTADGWLCLNLPRPDDWALMAAWLERDDPVVGPGDWTGVARSLAERSAPELVERAALLGLAASLVGAAAPPSGGTTGTGTTGSGTTGFRDDGAGFGFGDAQARTRAQTSPMRCPIIEPSGASVTSSMPGARPAQPAPLVIDLSSLWAGPLCGSLLAEAGCRVVKVEDPARPDGTRRGPRSFFDLMHAGKQSVALDLTSTKGRDALRELCIRADVVITSARPRALEPLGLFPPPAPIWVAITGYGLTGPWRDRVAFGDDAAVAAGLCAVSPPDDPRPRFCGDAVADPVAGLLATLGALALLRNQRSGTVDIALREAASHLIGDSPAGPTEPTDPAPSSGRVAASRPRARTPRGAGPELGRDTTAVFDALGITVP